MADSDKNIVITPSRGSSTNPTIIITGGNASPVTITGLSSGSAPFLGVSGSISITGSISAFSQNNSGFTFGGTGNDFFAYYPRNTDSYPSGLFIRRGVLQLGGSNFASGLGNIRMDPSSELFYVAGRMEMIHTETYQASANTLTIAIGASHTGNALRVFKQAPGALDTTKIVAGIDNNGVVFSTAGISAAGATFNGNIILRGILAAGVTAPTILAGTTISPTTSICFISGTTLTQTITPPSGISLTGGQLTLIPTGLWSTGTSGNIALATTAVVNRALIMVYDAQTVKWYPSY